MNWFNQHEEKNMFKISLVFILTLVSTTVMAHGMSAEDQLKILNAGYLEYIELGATHMITGYDHLLFLFGVIFFLTRFNDIIKFITAFTIGHSITLIFTTLYGIKANFYLIDAVIALTVCYKAFDNLDGFKKYFQMNSPSLLWMVLGFGLIHGFGLSTRLQQLPLSDEDLVLRVLAFNVGVEIGQIIALAIMLFLLSGWRKYTSFQRFSQASNWTLMLAGGLLLMMQLHGYQHTQFSNDFPISKDDHHHVHQNMREQQNAPLSNYPKRMQLSNELHSHDGENTHTH